MRVSVVPQTVRRFGEAVADEQQRLAQGADRLGAAGLDPGDFGRYARSAEVAASYQRALAQVVDGHRVGARVLLELSSLLQNEIPRHLTAQDRHGADALHQVTDGLHRSGSTP